MFLNGAPVRPTWTRWATSWSSPRTLRQAGVWQRSCAGSMWAGQSSSRETQLWVFKASHTRTNEAQTYWNPETEILLLDVWLLKNVSFFYFKFYQSCLGEHGWDLCWWPGQTTGFAVSDSWSHPDSPRTFGGNGKPLTHLQKENPGTIETQHGDLLLTSSAAEWTGVRLLIFDISGAEPRESIKTAVISLHICFLSFSQLIMRKIKEVDLDALASSLECPSDQLERLKLATPEVYALVCAF